MKDINDTKRREVGTETESRRDALGALSKITLGAWSLPIVSAIATPAHASMSPTVMGPEPAMLTIENAEVDFVFCRGGPIDGVFHINYDFVSEAGVVSHRFDLEGCADSTVATTPALGTEIPNVPVLSFDLTGDDFMGSVNANANGISSMLLTPSACALIITITDADDNTASQTVLIDECSTDD